MQAAIRVRQEDFPRDDEARAWQAGAEQRALALEKEAVLQDDSNYSYNALQISCGDVLLGAWF